MKAFALIIALLAGFAQAALQAAGFVVPPAGEAVTDAAGILTPGTKQELETLLRQIWSDGGSQLAVVTVPDLGGLPIEQAALKIAEAWQLGTKEGDQGIVFLIAPNERRMRIEVGQGREGDLPDAIAKRIITQVVTPYFQRGDFDSGVRAGTLAILERTDPERLAKFADTSAMAPPTGTHRSLSLFELAVIAVILLLLLGTPTGRTFLFFWLMSGGRGRGGGGGWSGGGGRGGGYSGGGGGFSGGGASGSW